jgi:hypothetical protein
MHLEVDAATRGARLACNPQREALSELAHEWPDLPEHRLQALPEEVTSADTVSLLRSLATQQDCQRVINLDADARSTHVSEDDSEKSPA